MNDYLHIQNPALIVPFSDPIPVTPALGVTKVAPITDTSCAITYLIACKTMENQGKSLYRSSFFVSDLWKM